MPRKQKDLQEESKDARLGQLLGTIQPLISMVVLTTGLVVWAFNTFAQIAYVEKQNAELKTNIDNLSRTVKSIEDQFPKAIADAMEKVLSKAQSYSDGNREKTLPAINDVKDGLREVKESVKSLESRLLVPINSVGGQNAHR